MINDENDENETFVTNMNNDTSNTEIICNGSILHGNNCGKCSRCKREMNKIEENMKERARVKSEFNQSLKDISNNAGWVCSKCGRSNSPYLNTCPCFRCPDTVIY